MDGPDFPEIARLINHSRVTTIEPAPRIADPGKWAIYTGQNSAPGFSYPIEILYLGADCTQQSLAGAANALKDPPQSLVVHAQSLNQRFGFDKKDHEYRRQQLAEQLRRPRHIFSTREYLHTFLRDQLGAYTDRLRDLTPLHFVAPRIEVPLGIARKFPNPLKLFLEDPATDELARGAVAVLLAEPGQGKTYMARHLAVKLNNYIPLYIDSRQWTGLPDAATPEQIITNTFRYFDTPISWMEGFDAEFLRVTLKAGLFAILFDGFDEYVLRSRGKVAARDAVDSLKHLAGVTGGRILVTSRTSFWTAEVANLTEDDAGGPAIFQYKLLPFDRNTATNYFKERFKGQVSTPGQVNRSLGLFDKLSADESGGDLSFVGRGFVLHLIADLVDRTATNPMPPSARVAPVSWIMEALCQREAVRQQLPATASQQLQILRLFAWETFSGGNASSEVLALATNEVTGGNAAAAAELMGDAEHPGKLRDHPLIRLRKDIDRWEFAQEQVGYNLLAQQLLEYLNVRPERVREFLNQPLAARQLRIELANALLDQTWSASGSQEAIERIKDIARKLRAVFAPPDRPGGEQRIAAMGLAADIALLTVNRFVAKGSQRRDRTAALLDLLGGELRGLEFAGTIASMDFAAIVFRDCRFDDVIWENCIFDETTLFGDCTLSGGGVHHSEGFGVARWESCWFDADAQVVIREAQGTAGKRAYTREDLRSDMGYILSKFAPKEGFGLRTVELGNLRRNITTRSRHGGTILEELLREVLERHHISGSTEGGTNVSPKAKDDVLHFSSNGVLTGSLARAFESLCKRLGI